MTNPLTSAGVERALILATNLWRNPLAETVTAALSAAAALSMALNGFSPLSLILTLAAILLTAVAAATITPMTVSVNYPTGSLLVSRSVLTVGIVLLASQHYGGDTGSPSAALICASIIVFAAVLGERLITRVHLKEPELFAHMPGATQLRRLFFPAQAVFWVNIAAITIIVAAMFLSSNRGNPFLGQLVGLCAALLGALAVVFVAADSVVISRLYEKQLRTLTRTLSAYDPTFLVHWDAPRGTHYQLTMWLPYLEKLGQRFVIILRNPGTFEDVKNATSNPVILLPKLEQMDLLITDTLKAVFYMNTATKNAHMVRYTHLHHVQLNHGDSDKAPSYNPVFRMYSKNFVAGQAAIDRFHSHGVTTQDNFFEIVGRPQVASLQVTTAEISELSEKTVLYAPTWAGFYADSNYSSLLFGHRIVSALLDRGCTVIFRSHPYSNRNKKQYGEVLRIQELLKQHALTTGKSHRWGAAAEQELTVFDCFDLSDAMVADVSSVVPDFLYTEKPFAICVADNSLTSDEFIAEFPLSQAGYLLRAARSEMDSTLDKLLEEDPIAHLRRSLKSYYLGDFPAEHYESVFVDTAKKYLSLTT